MGSNFLYVVKVDCAEQSDRLADIKRNAEEREEERGYKMLSSMRDVRLYAKELVAKNIFQVEHTETGRRLKQNFALENTQVGPEALNHYRQTHFEKANFCGKKSSDIEDIQKSFPGKYKKFSDELIILFCLKESRNRESEAAKEVIRHEIVMRKEKFDLQLKDLIVEIQKKLEKYK